MLRQITVYSCYSSLRYSLIFVHSHTEKMHQCCYSPTVRWGLLDFMWVVFSFSSSPTAMTWAQCSLPDLNRDPVSSVFRAGPQPRSCEEICQKECQKECQIYGRFMLPCLIPVYSYMFDRCSPDMSSGQEMKSVQQKKVLRVSIFNVLKWYGGDCSKWSNSPPVRWG